MDTGAICHFIGQVVSLLRRINGVSKANDRPFIVNRNVFNGISTSLLYSKVARLEANYIERKNRKVFPSNLSQL